MKNIHQIIVVTGLTCAAAWTARAVPTVEFQTDPGFLSCDNMSDDGRYILGSVRGLNPFVSAGIFIWDTQTNSTNFLNTASLEGAGISNDGSVVIGDTFVEGTPGDPKSFAEEASIWTESMGFWQSIGFLPDSLQCPSRSNAFDISGDGSVVVGLSWDGCSGRAFRWTESTGMQQLEVMGSGGNRASAISTDGSTIGGFAQGTFSRTPVVWDADTLEGTLLGPGGADAQGEVYGITDDGIPYGTVYTGAADGAFDAVRWVDGQAQVIGTGSLLAGWGGNVMDIADDGTVVGFDFLQGNRRPWIQPQGTGPLIELNDWALAHGAELPEDWEMIVPRAISADGNTIIGFGFEPTGIFGFRLVITPGATPDCDGDANGDLLVNLADLNLVLANFGTSGPGGDVTGNGSVDLADLNLVLANFGTACE